MNRLRRWINTLISIYVTTFLAIVAFALAQPLGEADVHRSADLIVVLGGGMEPDGRLHRSSTIRVDRGVALFRSGVAPKIHFTGGVGEEGGPSAGAQMAKRALDAGIPAAAISTETHSQSTLQNALFSKPYTENMDHIILVTEGFHLPRSWATFKLFGAHQISLVHARRFRGNNILKGTKMVAREALAIWFNAARYVMWLGAGAIDMPTQTRDQLLT